MLNSKQSRILSETFGAYTYKTDSIEKMTEELIIAMDEKYLDSFFMDFILDKENVDKFGGKSIRGATHYAKPYINKSIKKEVEHSILHIQTIRTYMMEYIELAPENYNIYYGDTLLATRQIIEDNDQNMYDFLERTKALVKELALKKRGVETMGSFLAEEVQPQLEYTH